MRDQRPLGQRLTDISANSCINPGHASISIGLVPIRIITVLQPVNNDNRENHFLIRWSLHRAPSNASWTHLNHHLKCLLTPCLH